MSTVGYLLRKTAVREEIQSKRKNCASVSNVERVYRSEECFDIRLGHAEFGDCSAGFWCSLGTGFPHNDL